MTLSRGHRQRPASFVEAGRSRRTQSRHRKAYEEWLREALSELSVLPVLDSTTVHYATLCHELKKAGTPIPTNDAWIAALSREHQERTVGGSGAVPRPFIFR